MFFALLINPVFSVTLLGNILIGVIDEIKSKKKQEK
jgi:hypothetical protein